MLATIDMVRLLDGVNKPEGLDVVAATNANELMVRQATLNKGGWYWYGTAFIQGNRLMFTTAMPTQDYLNIVKLNQAKKGSTVEEMRKASNRARVNSHQKDIKNYLGETACTGDKYIFPNFMVNYGSDWVERNPKARLTLLVTDSEALAFAAVFEPPAGISMPVTDGGHRTSSLKEMIEKHPDKAGIASLLANAVGVTFVMEQDKDDAHQDFADAGKARPIEGSVIATFDKRNQVVRYARDLVEGDSFLSRFVDATSPSVNLSSNSKLAWSMSAVRGSILSALPGPKRFDEMTPAEKTAALDANKAGIAKFMQAAAKFVPIMHDMARADDDPERIQPGALRKQRGGCVLLRGAGFGLLMRAYRFAEGNGIELVRMAQRLGQVDWFVLKDGVDTDAVSADTVHAFLGENADPAWLKMIAFNPGVGTWRIKGTNENLDSAFAELVRVYDFKSA